MMAGVAYSLWRHPCAFGCMLLGTIIVAVAVVAVFWQQILLIAVVVVLARALFVAYLSPEARRSRQQRRP